MKSLVLIPSNSEHELFLECSRERWVISGHVSVAICGVGLVASAVETSRLLSSFQPERVFLIGIAGLLNPHASKCGLAQGPSIGEGFVADSVLQHGVGVGEGAAYQSAEKMGFHRFNSDVSLQTPDQLQLPATSSCDCPHQKAVFLSVMSTSSCPDEATRRRTAYPSALLEDMETYSVALACRAADVPLIAIRAISNVAGDRDFRDWKTAEAMQTATDILLDYL